MRNLLLDLRYGLRMLWKSRGFTAVSVLSLALGIGANTMIFSMVNALLIRPLPYTDAGRLYVLAGTQLQKGIEEGGLSYPDFVDWQEQNRSFESVAAFYDRASIWRVSMNRSALMEQASLPTSSECSASRPRSGEIFCRRKIVRTPPRSPLSVIARGNAVLIPIRTSQEKQSEQMDAIIRSLA